MPDPALAQSGGLVAAGMDLSPARLHEAYYKGMFPWFSPGDPVLWWSPDPRMVLYCKNIYTSRSLAKRIRQFSRPSTPGHDLPDLCITMNMAFEDVIGLCALRGSTRIGMGAARSGQAWPVPHQGAGRNSTWISADIRAVYTAWHQQGHVHSIETWVGRRLAGGLYGVSLGSCFFGESMFSLAADASKLALAYLGKYLLTQGVGWIDCQQETPHLASMGAKPISRSSFLELLRAGRDQPAPAWGRGRLMADGSLLAMSRTPRHDHAE